MPDPKLNQFSPTGNVVQGQMDLSVPGQNVTSGQVAASVVTPLVAGQAVKMEDSAGGVPKYLPLTANTDRAAGFVIYNPLFSSRAAGKPIDIASSHCVMYMTAGAPIARDAQVEINYNGSVNGSVGGTVITSAGTNPVVGRAYDKATAAGDVIRVYITAVV